MQVRQRYLHVGDRVEHVGADDHVEATEIEALILGCLFQIVDLVFNLVVERSQLLGRSREETCRHVSECVAVEVALQLWQHIGRQTTGASTDFKDSQPTPFWQASRRLFDRS